MIAAGLEAVAWGIFPFIDMDVLFLIGISLPLAYLFLTLDREARWGIILALFCATPVLQLVFGYPALPLQLPLADAASGQAGFFLPTLAGHWFIGGWFPVFPWLGIAFLGAELGTIRWTGDTITSFATRQFAAVALGMLGTGIALWALFPGPQIIRFGYVELFYPPVPGFCLAACGMILCMFVIADLLPPACIPDPLRAMGECSLSIYILHSVIIAWIIGPADILLPLPQFLLCISVFAGGMCAFAYLMRHIRPGCGGPVVCCPALSWRMSGSVRERLDMPQAGRPHPGHDAAHGPVTFSQSRFSSLLKLKILRNRRSEIWRPYTRIERKRRKYSEIERTGTMRIDQRLTSSTRRVSLSSVNFRMRIPETSTITSVA